MPLGLFVVTGLRDFATFLGGLGWKEVTLGSAKICLLPPVGNTAEAFGDVSVGKAGGGNNEQLMEFGFLGGRMRRHGAGGSELNQCVQLWSWLLS